MLLFSPLPYLNGMMLILLPYPARLLQWASLCSEDDAVKMMCPVDILHSVTRAHKEEQPVYSSRESVIANRS
jgi:hypothetical protein